MWVLLQLTTKHQPTAARHQITGNIQASLQQNWPSMLSFIPGHDRVLACLQFFIGGVYIVVLRFTRLWSHPLKCLKMDHTVWQDVITPISHSVTCNELSIFVIILLLVYRHYKPHGSSRCVILTKNSFLFYLKIKWSDFTILHSNI